MSFTDSITSTVQDQVLETVKTTQGIVLEAVRTAAEAMSSVLPDLPNLPFADALPKPEDVLEGSYLFTTAVLETQHNFAKEVLAATAPLRGATSAN